MVEYAPKGNSTLREYISEWGYYKMAENKTLKVGDKYLSISLLGGAVNIAAFKQEKKNENSPDYAGNGVAVWIKEKKEKKENDI